MSDGIVTALLVAVLLLGLASCDTRRNRKGPAVLKSGGQWEQLPDVANQRTYRLRTPGGWIVRVVDGVTYVPDPGHNWTLEDSP